MAAFQFYLQSGKKKKLWWVRDYSHVVSSKKNPWWKGSVRWYIFVKQQFFVAKVWGEVFSHFHAVAGKGHSSMRNWLFGLQGRCQRKWLACSWLCSSPVSVSVSLGLPFKHPSTAHAFFLERLSSHCQGLRRNFSKICTNCDAHSLSDPCEIASGQIHDSK
jgi:hypothetical protein